MANIDMDISHSLNSFRPEDFDTASVRSAAPSYISEAPSYHTTVSTTEPVPPYSPPEHGRSLLPSHTAHIQSPGLPPIPPAPRHSTGADMPSLGAFSIPSWSAINTNPTYHRVATRRAQAAMSSNEGLLRNATRILERVNEESSAAGGGNGGSGSGSGSSTPAAAGADGGALGGGSRVRPLEDPYLVGEVAAARARRERLARENGDDVLHSEDRRWDWFLAQTQDWEERNVSWKHFRRDMQTGSRGKLARRMIAGR